MIGSLRGKIIFLDPPYLIIDVNGVGYKVQVSAEVLGKFSLGDEASVFTYTFVREDALELFGFSSFSDLKLFEYLIGVSGIGPRTAINIFSVGSKDSIIAAITSGDVDFFSAVPRLGRKNAQKIIIELKTKLGGIGEVDLTAEERKHNDETLLALKSFGFTTAEIQGALKNIDKAAKTEEKIRLALKALGKRQ